MIAGRDEMMNALTTIAVQIAQSNGDMGDLFTTHGMEEAAANEVSEAFLIFATQSKSDPEDAVRSGVLTGMLIGAMIGTPAPRTMTEQGYPGPVGDGTGETNEGV